MGSFADATPARSTATLAHTPPPASSAAEATAATRLRRANRATAAPLSVAGGPRQQLRAFALLVGLGGDVRAALEGQLGPGFDGGTDQRETLSRTEISGIAGQCTSDQPGSGRRRERAACEQQRQLPVRAVPGGNGGVGQQHSRIGGKQRAGHGRPGAGRLPSPPSRPVSELAAAAPRQAAMADQDPRAHAHRRGRLGDPEHVQEPLGPAKLGGQERGTGLRGGRRDQPPGSLPGAAAGPPAAATPSTAAAPDSSPRNR